MDLRQLRARCRQLLERVEIPSPFDIGAFCEHIARQRGRRIHLHPIQSGSAPCGLWVAMPSADYVFYETSTSILHRDHIILHELSHMLCEHTPAPVGDDELVHLLLPHLDAGMVRRVLARTSYSDDDEREAELLASLIRERVCRDGQPHSGCGDVPAVVRRVESTFG